MKLKLKNNNFFEVCVFHRITYVAFAKVTDAYVIQIFETLK
jgi:hypothetical protein